MRQNGAWDLFLKTGLPEAFVLAKRAQSKEDFGENRTERIGPARDQVQRSR